MDLSELLAALNDQCNYYNLRSFTESATLFDEHGVFIIPVKTRTDGYACLSKATPVFAGKVHDTLHELYGSASAPRYPGKELNFSTLRQLVWPGFRFTKFGKQLSTALKDEPAEKLLNDELEELLGDFNPGGYSWRMIQLLHILGQRLIVKNCQYHYSKTIGNNLMKNK